MMGEHTLHSAVTIREPNAEARSRAVRVTASQARGARDLAELLNMLGLAASEARQPGSDPDQLARRLRNEVAAHRGHHNLMATELAQMLATARDEAAG